MMRVTDLLLTLLVYSLQGGKHKSPGDSRNEISNVSLFLNEHILFA